MAEIVIRQKGEFELNDNAAINLRDLVLDALNDPDFCRQFEIWKRTPEGRRWEE